MIYLVGSILIRKNQFQKNINKKTTSITCNYKFKYEYKPNKK